MDKIIVNIDGVEKEITSGSSLYSISKLTNKKFKHNILIAKVNGIYKELRENITKECNIEFLDLTDKGANRIYLNGLIYLTVYAYSILFPKAFIRVNHSIDKGLYIETTNKISEEDILRLKECMYNIVEDNLDITKVTVTRLDAINYFSEIGDKSKESIMKYNTNTYVTLYKLSNMYNYLYTLMPINTSVLNKFDLTYFDNHGFILQFPTIYINNYIKKYEHKKNIFNMFKQSRDWAKLMDLLYVSDLNKCVSESRIDELIQMDEMVQMDRLLDIAKDIRKSKKTKIILIAGPSSSGKTTTCNKLARCLRSLGLSPKTISMDDYFVERDKTPLKKDGSLDFESLNAIDLKLFNETMSKLLNNQEVIVPTFNFILGKKEFKDTMKLNDNDILIIEGIHALNPKILKNIDKEYKKTIYLSALSELNIDSHTRISTTDNRLLRRIIRDNRTRGHKIEDTLRIWANVREGEEENIFPYQEMSDYTFNTSLIYELGVLKTYVEPLLYTVDITSPYYNDAKRLLNFLRMFLPIAADSIPKDSIIREFIGGSYFKV